MIIRKTTYVYLKLTPDTSIRNYNSDRIAKTISAMYRNIFNMITKEEKKLVFQSQVKCSYFIDIKKTSVLFYFIVPSQHVSIIKDKIRATWPKVTIQQVKNVESFSDKVIKYQLNCKKEDALSLAIDKKSNEPLNSLLNVVDIMQDTDRIGIFYNFMPYSQKPWNKYYNDTIKKVKNRIPIDKQKLSVIYALKIGATFILSIIDGVLEAITDFTGGAKSDTSQIDFLEAAADMLHNNLNLSTATKKKKDSTIIDTQILVLSDASDKLRQDSNAISVCQSFKALGEDNELVYKRVKNVWYTSDFKIAGVGSNILSTDECSNFIQLPGRELLQQHKIITQVNTLESKVTPELGVGTKLIGHVAYRGNNQNAYLTTDKDYKNLTVAVIGPTRSGKTTLLGNLARNSVDCGECVIVLDWIENCGLSEEIKEHIPADKILEINLYDHSQLQGLGYNESKTDSLDPFLIYESAKQQSNQLAALANSINVDNSDFTPKMGRYLNSAALIVFIQDSAFKDVFQVLQNHIIRAKFIESIPTTQIENLQEYVENLQELDEWSKVTKENPVSEVCGTHTSYISGVIDRVDKLKSNTYMEMMLKRNTENNINLLDEMEKNQVIFIKMPEAAFPTTDERDIMTTYWITKIWMSGQLRAWKIKDRYKRKTVTVVMDELAQLRNTEQFVGSRLDQTAKFGIKFILSTMYINQLKIREKLRTANTSYILIEGSDKTNFKELKEEFEQFEYTLEDLMNLKRHQSLDYIKYSGGYTAFIAQLPWKE